MVYISTTILLTKVYLSVEHIVLLTLFLTEKKAHQTHCRAFHSYLVTGVKCFCCLFILNFYRGIICIEDTNVIISNIYYYVFMYLFI
ncbi:hypothetical protein FKM82_018670 [Ascaphus truei]